MNCHNIQKHIKAPKFSGHRVLAVAALLAMMMGWTAAFAGDSIADQEKEQQALFLKVAPSVVAIITPDGFGSGFFVTSDGLLLTNSHVVEDHSSVEIILHDGTKLRGEVVQKAKDKVDLALVQIKSYQSNPLTLEFGDLHVGTWIGSVGHGMGGGWTYAIGMVSNIYPVKTGRPVFQTQIPLNPGHSGAPVFDRTGKVVGIVTAGIMQAENVNFAIRADEVIKHLDKLQSLHPCLEIRAPVGVPIFVDGKMAGKGPKVVMLAKPRQYEVFAVVDGKMIRTKVTFPKSRIVDLGKMVHK